MSEKHVRVNHEIRAPRVRLVSEDGSNGGIVAIEQAIAQAKDAGLDLVEVSPNVDPPVCRILDYDKFRFEHSKRKGKKPRKVHLKEITLRPGTGEMDYQVKMRNIRRFLEAGDKVKVTLKYRGREMVHQELGVKVMERITLDIDEVGVVEQAAKLEGRQMVMVIVPKK